jgi:ATP-dependent Lon protease
MTWLRILHFFGLTNLSDEDVRNYETKARLLSALQGINKVEDNITRATRLHDLGGTVPESLRTLFVASVRGLNAPLQQYVLSGLPRAIEGKPAAPEGEPSNLPETDITERSVSGPGLEVGELVESRVQTQQAKTKREYYLREQIRAIREELGELDESGKPVESEMTRLNARVQSTNLPPDAREKIEAEFRRLQMMNADSAEATNVRKYIDWTLNLPWGKYRDTVKDLQEAQRVLDENHFGLSHIKEQVVEHIGVQIHSGRVLGRVLCIIGPPGVGKTSLAKSIAKATGRAFIRISLGGIRDEAAIRGHRRTYIGSLPGKIIHALQEADSSNPLILLDEIDKLDRHYYGDPAAALLDVLDPDQNKHFVDHFLDIPFDLSSVLFVTTANTNKIPEPLLDRMEVIVVPGYTEEEKFQIAKKHLLPKQAKVHGLGLDEWSISDLALRKIIRFYTREAGVRNLDREIATLARKSVRTITLRDARAVHIDVHDLDKLLGLERYKYGEAETENLIGVAAGLAWTEIGGELLSVEAAMMPGKGKVTITGMLGAVMRESAQAALSYVRRSADKLDIDANLFDERDIHVHVPEGSIAKDGPSAGVAMVVAMVSAMTSRPVRKDVAMTGEITLRGRIIKVGGLREKLLAANRAGIRSIILPRENLPELKGIEDDLKREINFIAVATMNDVFEHVLINSQM